MLLTRRRLVCSSSSLEANCPQHRQRHTLIYGRCTSSNQKLRQSCPTFFRPRLPNHRALACETSAPPSAGVPRKVSEGPPLCSEHLNPVRQLFVEARSLPNPGHTRLHSEIFRQNPVTRVHHSSKYVSASKYQSPHDLQHGNRTEQGNRVDLPVRQATRPATLPLSPAQIKPRNSSFLLSGESITSHESSRCHSAVSRSCIYGPYKRQTPAPRQNRRRDFFADRARNPRTFPSSE